MCTCRQFPLTIRLRVSCLGAFLVWPAEHAFDMRWIKLLFQQVNSSCTDQIIFGWMMDVTENLLEEGGGHPPKSPYFQKLAAFWDCITSYPRNMKHQQWNFLFISFCEFREFLHFSSQIYGCLILWNILPIPHVMPWKTKHPNNKVYHLFPSNRI